jgi:hypothetical protein
MQEREYGRLSEGKPRLSVAEIDPFRDIDRHALRLLGWKKIDHGRIALGVSYLSSHTSSKRQLLKMLLWFSTNPFI